mgnify:FL=1
MFIFKSPFILGGVLLGMLLNPTVKAAIISIQVPQQAQQDGTFLVEIHVEQAVNLYALQFDIRYDNQFSVQSIAGGNFLQGPNGHYFIQGSDNQAGLLSNMADTLLGPNPGVSGNGVIASVKFQAVSPGAGTVAIENPVLTNSAGVQLDVQSGTEPGGQPSDQLSAAQATIQVGPLEVAPEVTAQNVPILSFWGFAILNLVLILLGRSYLKANNVRR